MSPNIDKGIPIGTLIAVTNKVIPITINASPTIVINNRPVILNARANKFHTATNGHNNNGYFILCFCGISFSLLRNNFYPLINIYIL